MAARELALRLELRNRRLLARLKVGSAVLDLSPAESWQISRAIEPAIDAILARRRLRDEFEPIGIDADNEIIRFDDLKLAAVAHAATFHPELSWTEIAGRLGTTAKTLWEYRQRLAELEAGDVDQAGDVG